LREKNDKMFQMLQRWTNTQNYTRSQAKTVGKKGNNEEFYNFRCHLTLLWCLPERLDM